MKSTKRKIKYKLKNLFKSTKFIKLSLLLLLLLALKMFIWQDAFATPNMAIWQVRSIDTMKTSRDMARAKLYDYTYDKKIDAQVKAIKDLGANYISIDTPYDSEFLPYLKRWVDIARRYNLRVWFRGSFSGYEGWFDYPKNISPDELLKKTEVFIRSNSNLFKDEDIFDPCPECENGGFWPQPEKNKDYNNFVIKKNLVLKDSFEKIDKNVIYNFSSVIGGRAKDTLTANTFKSIGNVAAIDHYAADSNSYKEYIEYFRKLKTNVVVSEFGAPIPDIHGQMNDKQQADFIKKALDIFYFEKQRVIGLNYWVLLDGTTSLLNEDYSLKPVAKILKNYYSPAIIRGRIRNPLGDNLENINIKTKDGLNNAKTDKNGNYQMVIPAGKINLITSADNYSSINFSENLINNQIMDKNIIITPVKTSFLYNLRMKLKQIFKL